MCLYAVSSNRKVNLLRNFANRNELRSLSVNPIFVNLMRSCKLFKHSEPELHVVE